MKLPAIRIICLFLFFQFLSPPELSGDTERKVIKFVSPAPMDSPLMQLPMLVMTEAFDRLGYDFKIIQYPQKRSILLMELGVVDGDLIRIYDFNKDNQHPYYVRVNESHSSIIVGAFVTDPEITIESWEELINGNYRIGYLAGIKNFEQHLLGYVDEGRLEAQPLSDLNGLRQLKNGRVDVYLYSPLANAKIDLESSYLEDSNIRLAGCLEEVKMYPYFQKKHEALADDLAEKIREIKAEVYLIHFENKCRRIPTIVFS